MPVRRNLQHALSELMVCGDCGTRYRRCTWARGGKKRIVWRCINRLENGTSHCKTSPSIDEAPLHDALLRAMNRVFDVRDEMIADLGEALQTVTMGGTSSFDRLTAQQDLSDLEQTAANILALTKGPDETGQLQRGLHPRPC